MGRLNNDFDPNSLTQKTDEHTKHLDSLQKRVGTNENFGKTFKESAKDSKAIDEAIQKTVIKLLNRDSSARAAIEEVVTEIDNRQMKKQWISLGKIALWIISIIVTIIITSWVTSIVKDANHSSTNSSSSSKSAGYTIK
jgi:hypothetical protein